MAQGVFAFARGFNCAELRLRDASDADRQNFELYADGYAIHWPALDEDLSVPGLLGLPD